MSRKTLPFWLFVAALFVLLIVRDLFREGMFMDGLIYAGVSHNLANGWGTFWHPHFSPTLMPNYHEQPPLMFGIQSLFFKLLGNGTYVERIYGLCVALLTVLVMVSIWRRLPFAPEHKRMAWLPVLFWLCVPVSFWSHANNMEEPTMGLFTLISTLFILRSTSRSEGGYLDLLIAGISLVAASMCKGPQGLFPLAAVFFHWLVFRRMSFARMVLNTAFLVAVIASVYALLLIDPAARSSYADYFHVRIVTTFTNPAYTHTNWFTIPEQLFWESLPMVGLFVIIALLLVLRARVPLGLKGSVSGGHALWFLLIALSGTLPLMITVEQSGYYLVTVFPYYAFVWALLCTNALGTVIDRSPERASVWSVARVIALVLVIASFGYSAYCIGYEEKRDGNIIHDIRLAGGVIGPDGVVGVPESMRDDWRRQGYFVRYHHIGLDAGAVDHPWFFMERGMEGPPEGYEPVDLALRDHLLFRRRGHGH